MLRHRFRRVVFDVGRITLCHEAAAQFLIIQDTAHRTGQRLRIIDRDQQAVDGIVDMRRRAGTARRDQWRSRRPSFKDNRAERLVTRGQNAYIRRAQKSGTVRPPTEKTHAVNDAELACLRFQSLPQGPVTRDPGIGVGKIFHRREKGIEAFFRMQPGERKKNLGLARRRQSCAIGRRCGFDVRKCRHIASAAGGHAVGNHMRDDIFGHADKMAAALEMTRIIIAAEPADDRGRVLRSDPVLPAEGWRRGASSNE